MNGFQWCLRWKLTNQWPPHWDHKIKSTKHCLIEQGVRTPSFWCHSTTPYLDTWGESPNPFLTWVFLPVQWTPILLPVLAPPGYRNRKQKMWNFWLQVNSSHHERGDEPSGRVCHSRISGNIGQMCGIHAPQLKDDSGASKEGQAGFRNGLYLDGNVRKRKNSEGASKWWRIGPCWQVTQGVLPFSFCVRCLAEGSDSRVRPRMEALHACLMSVNCGTADCIKDQRVTNWHTGGKPNTFPHCMCQGTLLGVPDIQEPGFGTTCPPHQKSHLSGTSVLFLPSINSHL